MRKSAISYVSAKDEEDTDGIGNIGANASKFVGTVFTDLSGRKVARPARVYTSRQYARLMVQ